MCIPCGKTFSYIPSLRSFVKVKCQGSILKRKITVREAYCFTNTATFVSISIIVDWLVEIIQGTRGELYTGITSLMYDNGLSKDLVLNLSDRDFHLPFIGMFNPFPNKPWFLRVCSINLLKTL